MKHAILLLTLIGAMISSGRRCEAQNLQIDRPSLVDAVYPPPAPYYISEGLNGNEVYPKVVDAKPALKAAGELTAEFESDSSSNCGDRPCCCSRSCCCCACCGSCCCCCCCVPAVDWKFDWLNMTRIKNRVKCNLFGEPDAVELGDLGFPRDSVYRACDAVGFTQASEPANCSRKPIRWRVELLLSDGGT